MNEPDSVQNDKPFMGAWRSGSANALHALGRGFKPHSVHLQSLLAVVFYWIYMR